jgi:hypothetical protein
MSVCARIRPPNEAECRSDQHRPIIQQLSAQCILFDPAPVGEAVGDRVMGARRNKDQPYKFDHVFGADATQEQVYEHTAGRVVGKVVQGCQWLSRNAESKLCSCVCGCCMLIVPSP